MYHVLTHNNGEEWIIKKAGEARNTKSFTSYKEAIKFVDQNYKGKKGIKVYINNEEGKAKRYI